MLPLQAFKAYISSRSLFAAEEKILLAVSGGKDSVLMAHLFKQSGFIFGIAHCNFNLRADESQRDENFVRMLAATLGVPFHITHFETKVYAAAEKISTQMAARKLRYEWFEQLREEENYQYIALAQHQDDVIETILLNLTRGTGIAGLHGIFPKRGHLIRPLLFLSRSEIDELVANQDIPYVEDSSNQTSSYARNKIRHQVVPVLKAINPNLEQTFQENIRRFSDTELVLQQAVAALRTTLIVQKDGSFHLSIKQVRSLHPAQLLLSELLKPYGFTEQVIAELLQSLDKQSGTTFYSTSHRIIIDREDLVLDSRPLVLHNFTAVHQNDSEVPFLAQTLLISRSKTPFFERNPQKAFIDARLLIYPLILRSWQAGDKFRPLGMKTFKKLSNFFVDEKLPVHEKEQVPVLVNGNGDLVWIGGMRQDDRYKVTGSTRETVIFELQNSNYTNKQE